MNKKVVGLVLLVILLVIGYFVLSTSKKEVSETPTDSVAVKTDIVGLWGNVQDAKFTREFKADGMFVDSYEADASFGGTWKLFTKAAPEQVDFPLEDGVTYVHMVTTEEGENLTLTFKVSKLTASELELVFMEQGGMLSFARIK